MDLVGTFVKIIAPLSILVISWQIVDEAKVIEKYCKKELAELQYDRSPENIANLNACVEKGIASGGSGSDEPIKRRSHL